MRKCPFTGCGKTIPDERFACFPHWKSLTGPQQSRVWECYRNWQAGRINGDELRRIQQAVLDESTIGGLAE